MLRAVDVSHCTGAKAVSLSFRTGFKFSYSGDCRPSSAFVKIGRNSTVLLHEATFDDELQGDAEAKKHSTTSEAIAVGVAMGARRVLLTHFSQRYQKIPVMESLDMDKLRLEENADVDEGISLDTDDAMVGVEPEQIQDQAASMRDAAKDDTAMEGILDSSTPSIDPNEDAGRSSSRSAAPVRFIRSSDPHQRHATNDSSPLSSRRPSPSLRPIIPPEGQLDMKVGVCFDYMRVKVRDIAVLEKFTPALLKLYEEPEKVKKTTEEAAEDGDRSGTGKKSVKAGKQNKMPKNNAAPSPSPSLPTAFMASVAAHSMPLLVGQRGKAKPRNANKRNFSTSPSLPTAFLASVAAHSTPLLMARNSRKRQNLSLSLPTAFLASVAAHSQPLLIAQEQRKRQSLSNSLPTAFLASVAAHSQPLPVVVKGNANKRHSRGDGRNVKR